MYNTGGYPGYSQGSAQHVSSSASYPATMGTCFGHVFRLTFLLNFDILYSGQGSMAQRIPGRSTTSPGSAGYGNYPQGQQYSQYQQQVQYQMQQPGYPPNPAVNYVTSSQYPQPYNLQGHRSPPRSPTSSSPGAERFPCERCTKTFTRAHDRKRHFETHHSPQPPSHKCMFCHKEFSRADSLKRHVDNGCEKDPNQNPS